VFWLQALDGAVGVHAQGVIYTSGAMLKLLMLGMLKLLMLAMLKLLMLAMLKLFMSAL
jgi:hypothetical protein